MVFDLPSIMHEMPTEDHLRGVYGEYWPVAHGIAWIIVLRTAASEAQNHRCCYCGIRTTAHGAHADRPTLEHVVPRARGGRDDRENCVMACNLCNLSRGEAWIAEESFLEGGSCDEATVVERWVGSRGAVARRRRMREDMRTAEGWAMSDAEVAARHDVSVDDVAKHRRHRGFVLSVLAAQDRVCPACGRAIRDDGSMIAPTTDGVRRFEVVHTRCHPAYRSWLTGQGRLPDAKAAEVDGRGDAA